jgi:ubiquinone/menaquinone biosynthesis C-methylase UbiE
VRRPEFIARQSRCPTGFFGRLIGLVMSFETAAANDEALKALGLEPRDRMLEVGFGHGRTIERAASLVPGGFVAGIDASREMVDMATRRCRPLIDAGRVRLARGDSAALPYASGSFDKICAVHTIYFWREPKRHLRELRRVLRDNGRLVLGFRTSADAAGRGFPDSVYTFYAVDDVRCLLEECGFTGVQLPSRAGFALAVATASP